MYINYAKDKIRRSRLIMPITNEKFLEKAYLRNADAVVLDLEDSIPLSQKIIARNSIKNAIPLIAKGGSDVLIRVNNTEDLLKDDIEASILPGVNGIYVPKVESAAQVKEIDELITGLELSREIPAGEVKMGILIETVKGISNIEDIVKASTRIDSLTLGLEDFSVDSGIELSEDTFPALLGVKMKIVFSARAYGKMPMGLMGSLADFKDINNFKKNAQLAYKHGFLGASCIHPSNVELLNECFSPASEEISYSHKVVEAIEEGRSRGVGAVTLDGKMIDAVHYEKAIKVLDRNFKIEEIEKRKKRAREAAGQEAEVNE